MLPRSVSEHLSRVRNTNYWADEMEYDQGRGHVHWLLVARRRSRRRPLME
jgi:predicted metal-dependent HD superfamily phosphohydrolase